jgi:NitT/TauT family transport system permease protein
MNLRVILFPVIPFLLVTGMSQFLVMRGWVPSYLLPAPSQVFKVILEDHALFSRAFFETALASALGLALSMILGVGFALLLSLSNGIRFMFYPYAIFFQTVPIIAIAPLLVIWLGYGMPTVVAAAFIVSIFPVIANSVMGLLSTDPLWLSLFKMMDASPLQILFKLRFQAAVPQILTGFKVAAGLAVIGSIVGEFISGSGLGGLVDTARNQQRVDRVFAAVILAAVLGILFFGVISGLTRVLVRYRR